MADNVRAFYLLPPQLAEFGGGVGSALWPEQEPHSAFRSPRKRPDHPRYTGRVYRRQDNLGGPDNQGARRHHKGHAHCHWREVLPDIRP